MSFEQDRNHTHHGHKIETISIAAYERPDDPITVEIECTRCADILFHLDLSAANAADFAALLAHVGHGAEVIEEGAALVCRTDGTVLYVADQED